MAAVDRSPGPTLSSKFGPSKDTVIVLNERHLKRLMTDYVRYYHEDRTHLALEKRTPAGRVAAADTDVTCEVLAMPRVGGLHHHYSVAA
jgi:putative transposase